MNEYDDLIAGAPLEERNEYDELLEGAQNAKRESLQSSMFKAKDANPDAFAEVRKLAKENKLPTAAVEQNLPEVRSRSELRKNDYDKLITETPALAQFLSDPENAKVAKDDVENMGWFERMYKGTAQAYQKGKGTNEMADIGIRRMFGEATDTDLNRLEEIEGREGIDYGLDGFIEGIPAAVAESLPITVDTMVGATDEAAIGGGVGFAAGTVVPAVGNVGGAVTGAGVGFNAGLMYESGLKEAGLAYNQYISDVDENGDPIDHNTALGAAIVVGVINGGLEGGAIGKVTGVSALTKNLRQRLGKGAVKEALKNPTARRALASFGQRIAENAATEGITEGLQEISQIVVGKFINASEFENMTTEDIITQVAESARAGAQAGIGLGAPASTIQLKSDMNKVRQAESNMIKMRELGVKAKESKLIQRDPDAAQAFMKEAGADGDVYIPADKMKELFQSDDIDAGQILEEIGIERDQYDEAVAVGGDVTIPLEVYTTRIAPTDYHESLLEHLRLHPDDMTKFEASKHLEGQAAKDLEDVALDAEVEAQAISRYNESSQKVYDDVYQQLINAGMEQSEASSNAAIYKGRYEAWATLKSNEGNPVTAYDLYAQNNLKIRGQEDLDKAREANQSVLDMIKVMKGDKRGAPKTVKGGADSILSFIRKRGGISYEAADTGELLGVFDGNPSMKRSLKRKNGSTLEDMWLAAVEAGYLPQESSHSDLTDLLEREASGEKVYPIAGDSNTEFLVDQAEQDNAIAGLQSELEAYGIDSDSMTSEEVFEEYMKRSGALYREYDQSETGKNLFVAHNLSGDNLKFADEFGGLAVPSIAVARTDVSSFDGFGEVTLIASPDLIDPKQDSSAKVFNADVYSPRFPRAEHKINDKEYEAAKELTSEAYEDLKGSLRDFDSRDLESEGMSAILNSPTTQYQYLKSIGKAPKIKYTGQNPSLSKALIKKYEGKGQYQIADDEGFKKDAVKHYLKYYKDRAKARHKDDAVKAEKLANELINEFMPNNEVHQADLDSLAREINEANNKRVDSYATTTAIRKKLENKKTREGFEEWVEANYYKVFEGRRIFNGHTYSGKAKYLPFDMETVVKLMKKGLRDGENFNYGVGSIRSTAAKQFKSIKQVQDDRDSIVSSKEFEALRKEVDDEFSAIADNLREHYKYDGNSFGYLDDASEALKQFASRGASGLSDIYENVPDEKVKQVAEFMVKLKNMPTEYFEAKVQRAVDLREFYGAAVPKGTPKDVIDVLKKNGIKVQRYDKNVEGSRNEAIKKFNKVLFQDKRGSIQLGDGQAIINLFEKSDRSTFLHETGHLFLEEMERMVKDGSAPEQIKSDFKTVTDWFGTADIGVDQHEQFARGFEAYLLEGKAPSIELQDAFSRFKAWLKGIYRSVSRLNVELNPEIRDVFDRMLATEEQIQVAAATEKLEADPAIMELMTDDEKASHINSIDRVRQNAENKLLSKAMKEVTRKRTAEWKKELSAVKDEVEEQINKEKLYGMVNDLTTADGNKLAKDVIVSDYGTDMLKALPRQGYAVYSTKKSQNAMRPDVAAEYYGYSSGEHLLEELKNMTPKKDEVQKRAEKIMEERHGDMLSDGSIEMEAKELINSGGRADIIAQEIRVVSERAAEQAVPKQVYRAVAKRMIQKKKMTDATAMGRYLQASRRMASKATQAVASGDFAAAHELKKKELINYYLYMESRDAKETMDKGLRFVGRFNKKNSRKNINPDYLEQIDGILERFDFRKSVSQKQIAERKRLAKFVAEKEAEGEQLLLSDKVENELYRQSYKDMTLGEFNEVMDSLKNLNHLGRKKRHFILNKEKRDYDEVRNGLVQSIEDNTKKRISRSKETQGAEQTRKDFIGNFFASHRKTEFMVREMDGFEKLGTAWEYLYKPINVAADTEAVMQEKALEQLGALFREYNPTEREGVFGIGAKKHHIKSINDSLSKQGILAVALNMGNADNKTKMMEGYGWNQNQIDEILDVLDEKDWKFVQGVWDYIETFKDDVFSLEERMTGVRPEAVGATPVVTKFGTFKGGYYPIKYDSAQSKRTYNDQMQDAYETMKGGKYGRAMTKHGHTKARVESSGQKIRLDVNVMFEHVNEVIHDLTHREAVVAVDKLINDPAVEDAIKGKLGWESYKQIDDWVKVVAAGDVPALLTRDKVLNHLRAGVSISSMGWKFSTALVQFTGYSQSIVELGSKYALKGLNGFYGNPVKMNATAQMVLEKSSMMRERSKTFDRDVNDIRRKFVKKGIVRAGLEDSFFYMVAKLDMAVAIPTWLGGYEKGMDMFGDEKKAIEYADSVVRTTQSAGYIKDLAGIQRGHPAVKLFTPFYSYFSVTYNMTVDKGKQTDFTNVGEVTKFMGDMMMLYIFPALLADMLLGRAPSFDDEPESWLKWAISSVGMFAAGTMIGVREFSSVFSEFTYGAPAGLRGFEAINNALTQAKQGEADLPAFKAFSTAAGIILHLPSSQINTTVDAMWRALDGEEVSPFEYMVNLPNK